MWPTDWTNDDEALVALLEKWRGGEVEAWEYSVSHGQLLIRIFHKDSGSIRSAYVLCTSCDEVYFQARWSNAHIAFSRDASRLGPKLLLHDSDRFWVSCDSASAVEADEFIRLDLPGRVA
jgi:hypothetical protein